jgi:hypothetical protein
MSVTITAQEITRANNPQPLGQTESGIVRANVYNDVVTDLNSLADTLNTINPTAGTLEADKLVLTKANVTQGTSKTTAVPITTFTGIITTVALSDAANGAFSFDVTNAAIAATNVVLVSVDQNSSTGFAVVAAASAAGKFTVKVKNVDASAALNAAIKIHYTVL